MIGDSVEEAHLAYVAQSEKEYTDAFLVNWAVESGIGYAIVEVPDSAIEGYNSVKIVVLDEIFLVSPELLWEEERKRQGKQIDDMFLGAV